MLEYGAAKSYAILRRKDERVILHFDYDCFYASVFEAENPALKSLPLAVQQKQIIVTCNYEARRRGLHKLQLITEARRICPEAVIVLGEDLTRFRDASKLLYTLLRTLSSSERAEKLGFDEVWLDVTSLIDENLTLLNKNDLANSFFQLSLTDPTLGFPFDATVYAGSVFPKDNDSSLADLAPSEQTLQMRLLLGSHLANYLRLQLEEQHGYTSTVGISTTKLVSKLVGNLNKPKGQTTLIPPYEQDEQHESNITRFLDTHDIGKIPGIGFKLAQRLREFVLNRPATFDAGLVYGGTKENVTVGQVRQLPGLSADLLAKVLAGPGTPHDVGVKVLGLLNGIDPTEVSQARTVPRQISIEDSYLRLDTMKELMEQLQSLSARLVERMRIDLTETLDSSTNEAVSTGEKWKWLAHPPTLRLTTRPRAPLNEDGTRQRSFKRISRSAPTPSFIFSQTGLVEVLAERLVKEALLPLFKKLHERSGWNLSLLNVAVTGMVDEGKGGPGRDIGSMFRAAEGSKKELDQQDPFNACPPDEDDLEPEYEEALEQQEFSTWEEQEEDTEEMEYRCPRCGVPVPTFARVAHERFHSYK